MYQPTTMSKKAMSALMSLALVVGLMPLPAYAEVTASAYGSLQTQDTVTDPTDIKTEHPYNDNEELTWTYTYDGEEDIAGLIVTFANNCITEEDYDILTITDDNDNVIAELSGDFSGKTISVFDTRSLTFMFSPDDYNNEEGFEVASITPITGIDAKIARMSADEKREFLTEDNITIDGAPASEYEPTVYPLATAGESQQKPEVSISSNGITLREDVDYTIAYYAYSGRVSDVSESGLYTLDIEGINQFNGYFLNRIDTDTGEYKRIQYEFYVAASAEDLIDLIGATEIPNVNTIDNEYPDANEKEYTIRDFIATAKRIEAGIKTLDGDPDSVLGADVYSKAQSIIEAAGSFVDINQMWRYRATPVLTLASQSGERVESTCKYLAGMPIDPDPICIFRDNWSDEETTLSNTLVKATYTTSDGELLDGVPSEAGWYGVIFSGIGSCYGEIRFNRGIHIVDSIVYARLDGDTLILTAEKPAEGTYYEDADETVWDDDLEAYIAKWYGERDEIKHLRFDGRVSMPQNISFLLRGLSNLESADFTGIAPQDGTFADYELFANMPESFTRVTFSGEYIPSRWSELQGDFRNPDWDDDDPDTHDAYDIESYDFESIFGPSTYGPWAYDASKNLWKLAKTDVEAPTAREGLVYDGAEKVAVEPGELYDVEGGSATEAGDYAATATLKDPKRYQWAGGGTEPLTIEWSIAKATVSEPTVTSVFAYDNTEKTAIESNDLYSVEGGSATDAGGYTATVTLKDSKNYKWPDGTSGAKTYEWSIVEPVSVEVSGAPAGLIWDGSEKVAFADTDLYAVEGGSATSAGTHTATLTLRDAARTRWADGGAEPRTVEWSIAKLDISKATVALGTKSYTYDGKAKKPQVASVKVGGLAVAPANFDVSYAANVNAGKATVTVKGKENCTGSAKTTFTIAAKQTTPSVTLSKASLAYNGKAQAPSVTVRVGGAKLPAKAYSVTLPKGRKNVGTYNVKVTLSGNYKGTKTVAYKIVPKATPVSKLAPGSKSLTVKWAKQTAQADGYEILLATNAKFTSGKKTVTVKGAKNASKAVKGLKGNTKYYVKVRTYKAVGKTKYYSAWSAAKSAKTKK